jgi:dipeptidyl-peptidase-4
VHFQNTIAFANALVEKGKEFESAFYPYRLHGIGGRGTQLHLFRAITRFLLQNL